MEKNKEKKYLPDEFRVITYCASGAPDIVKKTSSLVLSGYNIICTQGFTTKGLNELMERLDNTYNAYGKCRMGIGNSLFWLPYNERNSIITTSQIESTKTIKLPWTTKSIAGLYNSISHFALMPRVATEITFIRENNEDKGVYVLNTHLDYQEESIQIKQLEKIEEAILSHRDKYHIILTGSNMDPNSLLLSKLNKFVTPVKTNGFTWKKGENKKLVDNIWVSPGIEVLNSGTQKIAYLNDSSPHYAVFAKLRITDGRTKSLGSMINQ